MILIRIIRGEKRHFRQNSPYSAKLRAVLTRRRFGDCPGWLRPTRDLVDSALGTIWQAGLAFEPGTPLSASFSFSLCSAVRAQPSRVQQHAYTEFPGMCPQPGLGGVAPRGRRGCAATSRGQSGRRAHRNFCPPGAPRDSERHLPATGTMPGGWSGQRAPAAQRGAPGIAQRGRSGHWATCRSRRVLTNTFLSSWLCARIRCAS